LAVTLRSIGEAVVSTDVYERIVLFNQAAEQLTGWSSAEALGRPLDEVFRLRRRQSHQSVLSGVARALEHGEPVSTDQGTLLWARDGSLKTVASTAAPIRAENSKIVGAVLAARDVTDQERIEAELLRARRLESITILARGLAHDFNTLLTGILGNVSVGRMFAAADAALDERLAHAEKSCLRAKELTERLLSFANSGPAAGRPVAISELLRDAAHLALSGSNCRCECVYPPDLWPVQIHESQICQVIYDVVTNASQSMLSGGVITIQARNQTVQTGGHLALAPGRYIQIEVCDRGVGIPPEHLPRIFDPYFTTKQHGSGLALATAYFIMQRHKGLIQVDSKVGAGTTVQLYLPAAPKPLPAPVEPPLALPGLNGRVLLMDDESLILNLGAVVLKRLGYDVTLARDGEEAVQRFEEARTAGQPFAIVILDLMVQGGLGGDEALKKLRQLDPAVKAIVSSGYHDDPVIARYQDYGFIGAIMKPYHAADLAKLLSKTLSNSPSRPAQAST
jgi:PAS domain S-box-containing protein